MEYQDHLPSRPQSPDHLGNWELGNGRARPQGGVLRPPAGERAAGERQSLPELARLWAPENVSDHNTLPHQSSKSPPYTQQLALPMCVMAAPGRPSP